MSHRQYVEKRKFIVVFMLAGKPELLLFVVVVLFYFTSEGPTARMLLSRAPKKYKDERKDE